MSTIETSADSAAATSHTAGQTAAQHSAFAGQRQLWGHPLGLYLLFGTEMWERFSYYAMRALLVLYLADTVQQRGGGLGFSQADALSLYGSFTMLVYVTPLLGGYLADQYLGARRAILAGALLMAAGQFVLAVPPQWVSTRLLLDPAIALYSGLGLLVLGNGLFKPNISSLVGQLYPADDARRDSAFTVFYIGINSGMFLAGIAVGLVLQLSTVYHSDGSETRFYTYGFFLAGIGMLVGFALQWLLAPRLLGSIGVQPNCQQQQQHPQNAPLTLTEWNHIKAILLMGLFTLVFWTGFEQMGGLMNLYTDQFIDRHVFGIELNPAFFQSLNALFILLFAPVLALLWTRLGTRQPGTVGKFVLALLLLALGFGAMILAVFEQQTLGKASVWYLVAAYWCHTIGELCLSPVGLSMVSRLAPLKMAALLMGLWYLFIALANKLAGMTGALVSHGLGNNPALDEANLLAQNALAIFTGLAVCAALAALVLWCCKPLLQRWMSG